VDAKNGVLLLFFLSIFFYINLRLSGETALSI